MDSFPPSIFLLIPSIAAILTIGLQIWDNKEIRFYVGLLLVCVLSVFGSYDPMVWMMDAAPALLGLVAIIILLCRGVRFPAFLHAVFVFHVFVLMVGSYFSYARVPFFNPDDFLGETLDWTRNNYDKLGHFMQGFTPYVACRFLLSKRGVKTTGFFPIFLAMSVSLAVSALYELIEYSTLIFSVDGAADFIGSQGDPYDTQDDILWAFIGALTAMCVFIKYRWETKNP